MEQEIVLNKKTGRVLRCQDDDGVWWELKGECIRCGSCCYKLSILGKICSALKIEEIDGEKKAVCLVQGRKPASCVIYPTLPGRLFDTCGYRWSRYKGKKE